MNRLTPVQTVNAFIGFLCARDFESAFALCADDMEFENVPFEPSVNRGRDVIRARLESAYTWLVRAEYEIHFEIERDGAIVNERLDRHWFDDGLYAEVRVMGRWKVTDGKITLWRDYFDADQWHRNFNGGFGAYLERRASDA
ncbi:limonene-1,2-epoxide hydrolase family protein [Nocardioides sp. WS12]|uniref:limonene-1,2-epoxide hydrolase family protein n=1 Tax=Nocardioides sp. WS12 TaxID=2486272 RepID=UPI0015FACBA7|nr:limonene-1,2-epoxide hydrolase family protein [Nocardioides sp. WS12]